jgi:uncharacterized protein YwqG
MIKILWHPLLPAIALLWYGFRVWTGTATWTTAAGIAGAITWLIWGIRIWRSGEAPESVLTDESALRKTTEGRPPIAPPTPGRSHHDEQLRQAFELIRRMQREQAMPPPPVPTEEEIRATARPAIFLRRSVFPVPLRAPGRSYIGGLPRLPPELPWPEKETYERFALTFLAQIDLAELPEIESSPLPRSGTLYFFSDPNSDGSEPADGHVLFYAGDATNVPLRDLPKNARPYIANACGDPWPWLAEESVWARTNFRFPLGFAKFDSYREYFLEEGARHLPPRNKQAFDDLLGDELERCFGPLSPAPPGQWEIFRQDREEWPFAWTAIEYGARAIVKAVQDVSSQRGMTKEASERASEGASAYERIGAAALRWVERAATETAHARPDAQTRAVFRSEWRALVDEFCATSKHLNVYGPDWNNELLNVLVASCYVCASNDALDAIPEIYRSALAQAAAVRLHFPMHQMLGHGMQVQWAPIYHADEVLLLQLLGDDALGWHSNCGCALQFWISANALKQRNFGAVEMTLDCD